MMFFEHLSTDARNIQELELTGQKAANGRFIGRIENHAACAAALGDFVPKVERRERFPIRPFKMKSRELLPLESLRWTVHPLGIGQSILDRQPHIWR